MRSTAQFLADTTSTRRLTKANSPIFQFHLASHIDIYSIASWRTKVKREPYTEMTYMMNVAVEAINVVPYGPSRRMNGN